MGWMRKPRTTQERRVNGKRCYLLIDDYKVNIRASRNMSNLVEAWDDIWNTGQRSWKKHRKHQWRAK